MKHIFIINPAAGKKDSTQRIYAMAEALRQNHGQEAECLLTRHRGHATELVRQMCESGQELRFYACGGDGTANEVANGVLGFDNAAMTCIPVGTGNDFLRNFGANAARFSDAENLWDGPVFPLDVIDVNGRAALTIACAGLDARVARDVHKYGDSPLLKGKGSYVAALIVNFLFRPISSHWTVELDGVPAQAEDYAVITACNGRFYGGGFMPVAEARMDDGVLNTLVVKKLSRLAFLRFVGPYSKGEYTKFPRYAACHTAKTVRVRSERADIVVCLDGECINTDDATIRLSDRRLRFFGPPGCDCNSNARAVPAAGERESAAV